MEKIKKAVGLINPWYIDPLHITVRLLLALALGGLIGFERERSSHAAGFRTNILVCVGSALIMLLSAYGFPEFVNETNVRIDPARLAAQVISGIGFLGAGTILRNGLSVTGLTTAATLWVVAAIGLAVGAGFYFPAIFATALVLASLWGLNIAEKKYFRNKRLYSVKINALHVPGLIGIVTNYLESKGLEIRKFGLEEEVRDDSNHLQLSLTLKCPKPAMIIPLVEELKQVKGVTGVVVE